MQFIYKPDVLLNARVDTFYLLSQKYSLLQS